MIEEYYEDVRRTKKGTLGLKESTQGRTNLEGVFLPKTGVQTSLEKEWFQDKRWQRILLVAQSRACPHQQAAESNLPVHRQADTGRWEHRGGQSVRRLLAGRVRQAVCGVHV